ncbi:MULTISPECIES: TIGR01777 family oxidoreductase [Acinetobacter]|uniref:TIGR01777 family protein n=2 Tax=Acinetobacter TaxID=469 RepID=A0A365PMQ6_ACIJU|nr:MULTISPECIES: TIGR01777 family oxidoreductase [Acinetobacter]RBA38115.1 TIGR01777 family protein [Acinetobacter junii]RBA42600.1 TIGR01777 family protein [Acinetobacter junii]RBA50094.1 TIGR01777 family protein [Acinetobacter junii]WLF73364.1 TIGR01777 family oxidoreductase [Acinetobacter junii]
MQKLTVLVTGASGFIGSHLLPFLLKRQYKVIALTRQTNKSSQHPDLKWVASFEQIQTQQIDYVINLAGENIGQKRWSSERKQQLINSRVNTTQRLYEWLQQQQIFPKCIISGSAIGYYGIDPQEQWNTSCDENTPAQAIFMSELCQAWEQTALKFSQQNTKIIRLGIVFGQGGGILPQMLLPIRLNAAGKIGSGQQPVVWIHIQDVLSAIVFLLDSNSAQKVYNLVAPEQTNQQQFVKIASKILKRKPFISLPKFVFELALGEQSQLILNGQYVQPKALQALGFEFKYPTLDMALGEILLDD